MGYWPNAIGIRVRLKKDNTKAVEARIMGVGAWVLGRPGTGAQQAI